ncbi:DUF2249 domain-containing protein [Caulobacter sp.]|uniref:DUF2249 domain-containing protein n=1 Tax=Caulobacter sp. TaxID=78 RepID=UPI002B459D9C|nr:DUF2249 domain-containing protein [Caulobacter sp.]HJV40531.1 DUF2249 domain-containing protein [Caulobacter sp.]
MNQADSPSSGGAPILAAYPFDARGVAKRFRHAAIFGALATLEPGEAMRFVNDHDPIPLLRQMRERFGEVIAIEYRERGADGVVIDFVMMG